MLKRALTNTTFPNNGENIPVFSSPKVLKISNKIKFVIKKKFTEQYC